MSPLNDPNRMLFWLTINFALWGMIVIGIAKMWNGLGAG